MNINRFEKARLIGARALQLTLGAPPCIEVTSGMVNSIDIAFLEFERDVIPLTVMHNG
ncbi:MAG: DNA-directed RNA polymerase subunit K [Candidatus Micrarchaeota archaeon]